MLYTILIEFGTPLSLVRLIKRCQNERYSTVRVGKHLSDRFAINNGSKQRDDLSPSILKLAVQYAIKRVRVNQDGLKLNGTHQFLVYADKYIGWKSTSCREKYRNLLFGSKESGIEVNADKTKYTVMSRDQNAGRSHSIKVDKSPFERVEEFKYLETNLTNQNSIQETIKSRLESGNACYHSAQNLLSCSLLSRNLTMKIYKTIILPVVLYGCETWSLTLREESRLRCVRIGC